MYAVICLNITMSSQTFNAQTRIPMVLMDDIQKKLKNSGMTISEYIRNLIMIDVGKFPVSIPKIELDPEQESRILNAIKRSQKRDNKVLSSKRDINNYLESLIKDD